MFYFGIFCFAREHKKYCTRCTQLHTFSYLFDY